MNSETPENNSTAIKSNGIATASLVTGIVSLTCCLGFITGIPAIVFGVSGRRKADANNGIGNGQATAGLILGIIATILSFIGLILFIIAIIATPPEDEPKIVSRKSEATPEKKDKGEKSQATTSEASEFKVGDTIEFDGKEVTVTGVHRKWNSGNSYDTPQSGKEFIKVTVTIINKSDSDVSFNSYDWQIQDSRGVISDVHWNTYSLDGELSSGNLAPEGEVKGSLIFEVPEGDSGLIIKYNPSFWSTKNVEIHV